MKKVFEIILLLFVLSLVAVYNDEIHIFIVDNFIHKKEAYIVNSNDYYLDYEFGYVRQTNDFVAKNKQQVLDIFYTYLNNGADEFYFYCDYENCKSDVNEFTYKHVLVNINNFIHPFNTYNRLYITTTPWGKISIKVEKAYNSDEINEVKTKLNNVIYEIITDNMTDKEKIKTFHDYIINNTKYDINYIESGINDLNNPSHKANGPLIYSKALCGGYAHVMSTFLNILKIPNYRISSETHIWNLVYLDNAWYHLDLTWDDPVTSDKSDVLLDKYFIINNEQLESFNTGYHIFDKDVYIEIIN